MPKAIKQTVTPMWLDIKEFYTNRKVFLLTEEPYAIFMSECPYLDGVIIDKRLPRWNWHDARR